MSEPYWLPRVVKLELTYLEAGWLMAVIATAPKTEIMVKAEDGTLEDSTFPEELMNRLLGAVEKAKDSGEHA